MKRVNLSVVLAVGERSGDLAPAVATCLSVATSSGADLELIIADAAGDGPTAALADRLAATHSSVAVIHYPRRLGYRQVLYDAWGVARGAYIAALDLSTPAAIGAVGRLLAAGDTHAVVLGYRVPPSRRPRDLATVAVARARLDRELRDPALGVGLFRAELRELLAPAGAGVFAHAELYAAARRRGLPVTQIAVPARELAPVADERAQGGAALGAGVLLAACGLWLLRRWRRQP